MPLPNPTLDWILNGEPASAENPAAIPIFPAALRDDDVANRPLYQLLENDHELFDLISQEVIDRNTAIAAEAAARIVAIAQAVPAGLVLPWAGTIASVPVGYLFCNGQAVSRTIYATLFATIGVQYGIGDGATTFNVPDVRNRVIMGANADDAGTAKSTVTGPALKTGGAASFDATHSHTINSPVDYPQDGTNFSPAHILVSATNPTVLTVNTVPPFVAMAAIIKT